MTVTATDFGQFAHLRSAAEQHDPAALREVANQFESLFIQSMLKSMRDASLGDPLFGSDQHDLYQGMMDEQLALEMTSGKGIGLADVLVRQLGSAAALPAMSPVDSVRSIPDSSATSAKLIPDTAPTSAKSVPDTTATGSTWSDPTEFVRDIWPHARRAGRALNVAPEAIVAHAALETGWGAHVMPDANGSNSFNLFGIKAGGSWRGEQVNKQTLELQGSTLQPEIAAFRAYSDVSETFSDYTHFLSSNTRYSGVRDYGSDTAGFAHALQASGYATDPNYAAKLTDVANSPTMRRAMNALSTELKYLPSAPIADGQSVRAR